MFNIGSIVKDLNGRQMTVARLEKCGDCRAVLISCIWYEGATLRSQEFKKKDLVAVPQLARTRYADFVRRIEMVRDPAPPTRDAQIRAWAEALEPVPETAQLVGDIEFLELDPNTNPF